MSPLLSGLANLFNRYGILTSYGIQDAILLLYYSHAPERRLHLRNKLENGRDALINTIMQLNCMGRFLDQERLERCCRRIELSKVFDKVLGGVGSELEAVSATEEPKITSLVTMNHKYMKDVRVCFPND